MKHFWVLAFALFLANGVNATVWPLAANSSWPAALPGDVVEITNNWTSALTITSSGSPASPITLLCTNAGQFSTACWDTAGAIECNGKSNLVFTNLLILNTNNGTGLLFSNNSCGIAGVLWDSTIANCIITNIYKRTNFLDDSASGNCINLHGGGISIISNDFEWATGPISYSGPQPGEGTRGNIFITGNKIWHGNHMITIGLGNGDAPPQNVILTNVVIANNNMDFWSDWDATDNTYHMDGIIIFNNVNDNTVVLSWLKIYGNEWGTNISGTSPTSATAPIAMFLDGQTAQLQNSFIFNNHIRGNANNFFGNTAINNTGSNTWTVNNTIDNYQHGIGFGGTNSFAYNNVSVGAGMQLGSITTNLLPNVVTNNMGQATNAIYVLTNYFATIWSDFNAIVGDGGFNYSLQTQLAGGPYFSPPSFNSITPWQTYLTAAGFNELWSSTHADPHSTTNTPTWSATPWIPASTDTVLVGQGTNLTAFATLYNIPELTKDFNGNQRPSSGNWTIGAFNAASGSFSPAPFR